MKNITTSLVVLAILLSIGLACSKFDTKTTDNSSANKSAANNGNSNDSKIGSSSDNKNAANSNSKTSADSSKIFDSDDISSSYAVSGKNPNGQPYDGALTVKKQGEVYQFSWNTAGKSYDGVAVQGGNLVAAGFTTGADGKDCGAAVYRIGDTTIEGKLANWGYNNAGTQTAVLVNQTKTSGEFNLQGTDTDGTAYKGKLSIKQTGEVYQLTYRVGALEFRGTGIRSGDYLAVGAGKPNCGYAVYEIKDGNLSGVWGGIGTSQYGAETATRK